MPTQFSLEELLIIGEQLRDPNPNFPQQKQTTQAYIDRLLQNAPNHPAVLCLAARWYEKENLPVAFQLAEAAVAQAGQDLNVIKTQYRLQRFYGPAESADMWLELLLAQDPDATKIRQYLQSAQPSAVALGPGEHIYPGWLHLDAVLHHADIIHFDAREPLALPSNSMDYVFSEHMIEHITYADGQRLLQEISRVLKPGGRVRIATPHLQQVCALAKNDINETQKNYIQWINTHFPAPRIDRAAFPINNMFYTYSHAFVHDPYTLQDLCEGAGLKDFEVVPYGKSIDPFLCDREMHHLLGAVWLEEYQTLIIEAVKP